MAKWKCEVCGNEFENFHAQGFDNKIYCPLCYFKKENQELKLELSGYRKAILEDKEMLCLKEENDKLKKQLEEYENELEKADSITQSCIFNGKKESEISYRKCLNMLEKHKNQQKEFIKYLENEKDRLARVCSNTCEDKFDEADDILQKYKEIIGDDK